MPRLKSLRRRVGGVAIEAFFHGISRTAQLHPRARPGRHNVEVLRDIPYRGTGARHHNLDVYRPRDVGARPLPIVLYIHGGGFRILSKDTHWMMGLAFARRGFLVFNINYRLAPEHPFPAAVEDACDAYTWIVERGAQAYGGDPERMVIAGESAGANLTSALTIASSYPRPEPWARRVFDLGLTPRAAVPACGIFQVSDVERFRQRYPHMPGFIADRLDEVEVAYLEEARPHPEGGIELADPLLVFERGEAPARPLPPFFVPCGTRDPLLHDSRRLEEALRALDVPVQARYYPGEVHAFHAFVWRPQARACWRHTFEFLDAIDL